MTPIVALLYDFDKTLCTTDMEDYAFIPALGYTPAEFWRKANDFGRENRMDGLLAYMYTMIAECRAQNIRLDRDFLVRCGHGMELFPGVADWFGRINEFGRSQGVQVEHYVISSGLREIIEGSGIAREFREIYACEFFYDGDGLASWPKLDVNFTNKTQFVYRINKGVLDVSDDKTLNDSMPDDSKRVPFTNMIYVGDGLSDVPCMKMMRAYGGQAIAVYQQENRQAQVAREGHGHLRPADGYQRGAGPVPDPHAQRGDPLFLGSGAHLPGRDAVRAAAWGADRLCRRFHRLPVLPLWLQSHFLRAPHSVWPMRRAFPSLADPQVQSPASGGGVFAGGSSGVHPVPELRPGHDLRRRGQTGVLFGPVGGAQRAVCHYRRAGRAGSVAFAALRRSAGCGPAAGAVERK